MEKEKGKFSSAFTRGEKHKNLDDVIQPAATKKLFAIRLDENLITEIKVQSALSKQSLQDFTHKALEEYIEKLKNK
ncbi:TPA: hypothetical protein ACPQLU_001830 [Haemophilus influenzae]